MWNGYSVILKVVQILVWYMIEVATLEVVLRVM